MIRAAEAPKPDIDVEMGAVVAVGAYRNVVDGARIQPLHEELEWFRRSQKVGCAADV